MGNAAWREANADKMRQYRRDWYARNRAQTIATNKINTRRYIERNVAITREERDRPCADCGQRYPFYVMQFDHIGEDKSDEVGRLAYVPVSEKKLREEIAKCEVVCANCHCARTWDRGQRYVNEGRPGAIPEHPAGLS